MKKNQAQPSRKLLHCHQTCRKPAFCQHTGYGMLISSTPPWSIIPKHFALTLAVMESCVGHLCPCTYEVKGPSTVAWKEAREVTRLPAMCRWAQGVWPCGICLEEVAGSKCARLACKHAFCASCMQAHCRLHIKEGSLQHLRCPVQDCRQPLEPEACPSAKLSLFLVVVTLLGSAS